MKSEEELLHIDKVEKLKYKPQLINLEGIVLSTNESVLFGDNGLIKREPDGLMFDPTTHILYNIEYKINHTKSSYQKAKKQLRTSGERLQNIFWNWEIKNLYISGNYEIKEIL